MDRIVGWNSPEKTYNSSLHNSFGQVDEDRFHPCEGSIFGCGWGQRGGVTFCYPRLTGTVFSSTSTRVYPFGLILGHVMVLYIGFTCVYYDCVTKSIWIFGEYFLKFLVKKSRFFRFSLVGVGFWKIDEIGPFFEKSGSFF